MPGVDNGGGSSKGHLGHLGEPRGKDGSLLFASCVLRLFAVVPTQVSSCSGAAMIVLTASVFLSAAAIAALLLWTSSVKTTHRWGERERRREREEEICRCGVLCAVYCVLCTVYYC